ncbi:hypothetical protein SAMN00017405_0318 [Desulfonispora thiosulfatigenes DSM 11270]|uniref:Uncharacterized protein n=1 Tax=Desulfonispora thiosulfatigenes DSM 11270 TaxID=656914 RepID=A0A1W1VPN8_DESTI|nr:hypothetical protein [Desulfonispora thiosulfatigenes]SMB95041.1 hypothetical protein SAMN00017405_0318 [Desulfonispora thiosulfatigenes DSM 11270]
MNQFYKPLSFNKYKLGTINEFLDLRVNNYFRLLKIIEGIFGKPNYELKVDKEKIEGWFLTNKKEELIIEFSPVEGTIKVYCNEKNKITESFLKWLEKSKIFVIKEERNIK